MSKKRLGFTLVELLVVISIIGTLIGLLLPAVNAARESGRRLKCLNNQRQFGLALQQYDSQYGSYPGYVMAFPGTANLSLTSPILGLKTSWVLAITPFIEKMDIYSYWKDNWNKSTFIVPKPMIDIGVCPNNQPADTSSGGWLAHRVNSGYSRANPLSSWVNPKFSNTKGFIIAEGVCTDQYNLNSVRVGTSYISSKDGTSTTLLLAERSATTETLANPWVPNSTNEAEQYGFNWFSMNNLDPLKDTTDLSLKVNSNHPGGINVGFCGGNHKFLNSNIDRLVYMQLMAPCDRDVGGSAPVDTTSPPTNTGIRDPNYPSQPVPPLDEAKIP